MKTKFSILLATLALVLSANTQAAENTDAHHHHDHGSASPQQLQLNAGKKWATDAHLRQAMNDINQPMAKALPLIHKNQFGDQAYQALATTVSQKVAFAVEHCKLEPKADAMLHLVIADLMAGAETMEGKRRTRAMTVPSGCWKPSRLMGSISSIPAGKRPEAEDQNSFCCCIRSTTSPVAPLRKAKSRCDWCTTGAWSTGRVPIS